MCGPEARLDVDHGRELGRVEVVVVGVRAHDRVVGAAGSGSGAYQSGIVCSSASNAPIPATREQHDERERGAGISVIPSSLPRDRPTQPSSSSSVPALTYDVRRAAALDLLRELDAPAAGSKRSPTRARRTSSERGHEHRRVVAVLRARPRTAAAPRARAGGAPPRPRAARQRSSSSRRRAGAAAPRGSAARPGRRRRWRRSAARSTSPSAAEHAGAEPRDDGVAHLGACGTARARRRRTRASGTPQPRERAQARRSCPSRCPRSSPTSSGEPVNARSARLSSTAAVLGGFLDAPPRPRPPRRAPRRPPRPRPRRRSPRHRLGDVLGHALGDELLGDRLLDDGLGDDLLGSRLGGSSGTPSALELLGDGLLASPRRWPRRRSPRPLLGGRLGTTSASSSSATASTSAAASALELLGELEHRRGGCALGLGLAVGLGLASAGSRRRRRPRRARIARLGRGLLRSDGAAWASARRSRP